MQCFACCVHGAAVATRAAILRLWGQLYDACVDLADLAAKVVSLAMDTSRMQALRTRLETRKTNMLLRGVAKKDRPHKILNLNFGTAALLRGERRPRRLERLLAAPVLFEPLAVLIFHLCEHLVGDGRPHNPALLPRARLLEHLPGLAPRRCVAFGRTGVVPTRCDRLLRGLCLLYTSPSPRD